MREAPPTCRYRSVSARAPAFFMAEANAKAIYTDITDVACCRKTEKDYGATVGDAFGRPLASKRALGLMV